jgi:hypothetical protein
MADVDPALGQEILGVAQRQWVSHVHHYDQMDRFWRAVEIPERVAHGLTLAWPRHRERFVWQSQDTVLITAPAPSRTTDNKFSPLRPHSITGVASISWYHLPLGLARLERRSERLVWVEPSVADNSPGWARSVGATATLFYCVLKKAQSRLSRPSTRNARRGLQEQGLAPKTGPAACFAIRWFTASMTRH